MYSMKTACFGLGTALLLSALAYAGDVAGTVTYTGEVPAAQKRIITKDPNLKAILINIFGGIVRCDVVAEGVVAAFKTVGVQVPVVVRLEGTNAEKAKEIINQAGMGDRLTMAESLQDAAKKSVAATR